jgi:adenylate cyclase class 2
MAQEIEAKFYVRSLDAVRQRLDGHGATLTKPRVRELNFRFDTQSNDLSHAGQVLRLRQDSQARITYKDSGQLQNGALSRRELEFTVSDFDAAREFLEALGYRISFVYEKYRTTYRLDGLEVDLDEMPYGDFVEIEGQASPLEFTAARLGLRWATCIHSSYSQLFQALRSAKNLNFRDLTFDNFNSLHVSPEDLQVQPADGGSF